MPVTSGFNHVATLTTDMDRTVQFYRDAFEAEVMFEMEAEGDHPKMSILDLGGGAALNVFEVEAGDIVGDRRKQGHRARSITTRWPSNRRPCWIGQGSHSSPPAPRSVRSNSSAPSGRCSSATPTAWSWRSARRRTSRRELAGQRAEQCCFRGSFATIEGWPSNSARTARTAMPICLRRLPTR